jgi:hypothetical protein
MPAKRAKTFRDAPAVLFRHWPAGREHPGQRAARSDQLGAIAVAVVEHAGELRAQGLRREPQQIIVHARNGTAGMVYKSFNGGPLSHDPAPPPPGPRPFCRQVGDCVFTPPALAKVVGDGAGVLSRHWPAEERPYQRATISGGDFVQIVAVGVVKQFEQCPFREVLARFVVHAPKRYADRITNRSTADHPVPPRVPAAPAAAGPGPGRARRRDRRAVVLSGRVVGVNTAIISPSGSNAGIGFAIPIDIVNRVVPQLIRDGHVPTPGIGIVAANEAVATRMGIEGVAIVRTIPGSSAARAGLRGIDASTGTLGDVIAGANGQTVCPI